MRCAGQACCVICRCSTQQSRAASIAEQSRAEQGKGGGSKGTAWEGGDIAWPAAQRLVSMASPKPMKQPNLTYGQYAGAGSRKESHHLFFCLQCRNGFGPIELGPISKKHASTQALSWKDEECAKDGSTACPLAFPRRASEALGPAFFHDGCLSGLPRRRG